MRLDGVAKRYRFNGPWVLKDVSLTVPVGRTVRVDGANGTGKSTLLRIVAGVNEPTRGRISDRPRTGFVPERFPPALPFTAYDYLVHLGRVHGLDTAAAGRRADEELERFAATDYRKAPLAQLSKGTSQKVAVIQAFLAEPELLVLDEAWTGLDESSRATLDEAITGRCADGGTVVFVDHGIRRPAGVVWTVGGGKVVEGADRQGVFVIEYTGPRLAPGEDGVLAVEGDDVLHAVVNPVRSDSVLRRLLADPDTHIRGVVYEESESE